MKQLLLFSILAFFTLNKIAAQNSSISVIAEGMDDDKAKSLIDSALVQVYYNDSIVAIGWTDSLGRCKLNTFNNSPVKVLVSKDSFDSVEIADVKPFSGKSVFMYFLLKSTPDKRKGVRLVPVEK